MIHRTSRTIKDFYTLFTSGMSLIEIQRLVNIEAKGTYDFYVRNMQNPIDENNSVKRFFVFAWRFFLTFLLKLTPARRLFYAIALLLLLLGFLYSQYFYAIYSGIIFSFLLALEVADKLMTRDELDLAREIQIELLPTQLINPAGYELAAYSEVAQNVGGDYYDMIPLSDGSMMVVIGDVSGKGLSAALYMVKVQTTLQILAKTETDPRMLLTQLNSYIYGQLKRNYFLTISLVRIYPNGAINYCRAGHTPAILYKSSVRQCSVLQPQGLALGMAPSEKNGSSATGSTVSKNGERCFEEMLEVHGTVLHKNDSLLLTTDGVIEMLNSAGKEFGQERLQEIVVERGDASAEELKNYLVSELESFQSGCELRDDVTIVVIKRVG
ncbi:MAG: PP2C family protein-serine/threonine phosphatase [bacterium]